MTIVGSKGELEKKNQLTKGELDKPSAPRVETKTRGPLSAEAKALYVRDSVEGELGTVAVKATKKNTLLTFRGRRGEVVYRTSAAQLAIPGSDRGSWSAAVKVGKAFGDWLHSDQGRIHVPRFTRGVLYKSSGDPVRKFGPLWGLRDRGVDTLLLL